MKQSIKEKIMKKKLLICTVLLFMTAGVCFAAMQTWTSSDLVVDIIGKIEANETELYSLTGDNLTEITNARDGEANLLANIDKRVSLTGNETIAGEKTFSDDLTAESDVYIEGITRITSTTPTIVINDSDSAVDSKKFNFRTSLGELVFSYLSDGDIAGFDYIVFPRSGRDATGIELYNGGSVESFIAIGGASYLGGSLSVAGEITQVELSADPADPAEGKSVTWQSDGTGSGDDGDIMIKITAGGVTKTTTLIDFSALP